MADPTPPPPGGDEEKIIINGGVAARVLDIICERLYDRIDKGWVPPDARKLVVMLNDIEDRVFAVQREFLDQVTFKGPYPHAIDIKK